MENVKVVEIEIEQCDIIEVGVKYCDGTLITVYSKSETDSSEYIVNYDHDSKEICMICGQYHDSSSCNAVAETIDKGDLCDVLNDIIDDDNNDMYIKVDGKTIFEK